MPAPRVAHTPATSKVTKKMADQEMCVVCDGYSCVWPLAGVGSRPPGHQARIFVSSGLFVCVCPHHQSPCPRGPETKKHAECRAVEFHPHAGDGASPAAGPRQ